MITSLIVRETFPSECIRGALPFLFIYFFVFFLKKKQKEKKKEKFRVRKVNEDVKNFNIAVVKFHFNNNKFSIDAQLIT